MKNINKEGLALAIKMVRIRDRVTQTELSKATGLTQAQISRIENSTSEAKFIDIWLICNHLNLKLEELEKKAIEYSQHYEQESKEVDNMS